MTVCEAATLLEVRASTVYALCSAGLLSHRRVGTGRGVIRIDRADLDDYLARTRVECRLPARAPQKTGPAIRSIMGEMEAEEARRAGSHGRRRTGAGS